MCIYENQISVDMSNMILSTSYQGINSYSFQYSEGQIMLSHCIFKVFENKLPLNKQKPEYKIIINNI